MGKKIIEISQSFVQLLKNSKRVFLISWQAEKKIVIALLVLSLLVAIVPFYSSGINAILINTLVDHTNGGKTVSLTLIILVVIGFTLPQAIYVLMRFNDKKYWLRMGQYFDLMLLRKLGKLDLATHENNKFNDLLNKASERGIFPLVRLGDSMFANINSIIGVVAASIILISFDPWVFTLILIAAMPNLIVELKYGQGVFSIYDIRAENRRQFFSFRRHFFSLYSLIELKVFQNVDHFYGLLKKMFTDFTDDQQKNERKKAYRLLACLILSIAAMIASIVIVITKASVGVLQIGTMTFILASINRLQDSMHGFLMNIAAQYEESLFVVDIFRVMDMKPQLKQARHGGQKLKNNQAPRIVFDNVSFSYPDTDKLVLKNFNLAIEPNEKIAILGVNGVGKTTVIKLLCRFYDPISGKITVDDKDLREIDRDSWLGYLGIIFQDYADYNLPIDKMIALGRTNEPFSNERVKRAAKQAQADLFINQWPDKYKQMLGKQFKGGVEPSKGQRQRLALARLFYRDASIMVLDEPTALIDVEAEMKIFDELESLPEKTVIVISQRYSTVKNADKIVVIDDGEIIELGNHQQLMAENGKYAKLFSAQAERYS